MLNKRITSNGFSNKSVQDEVIKKMLDDEMKEVRHRCQALKTNCRTDEKIILR